MKVRLIRNLSVKVLVGTPGELEAGGGQPAVTADVARGFLGVSDGTFRNLIARGAIAPIGTVGKSFLFLVSDVDALYTQLHGP